MPSICFASMKGSPGVTATTLAVAAAWSASITPGGSAPRRKVLIEADTSGGALVSRYHLTADPNLVSLAAGGRNGFDQDLIWKHTQTLPGGLEAIAAPGIPAQSVAALDAVASGLGAHLARRSDLDALVDLGRLFPGSPALALAQQASALLILSRPRPEDLQSGAAQLKALGPLPPHVGWILVGDKPYGPSEVERAFGLPVVAVVADDRRSVESLEQGVEPRKLRRQPFLRTSTALAATLGTWLEAAVAPEQEESEPQEAIGSESLAGEGTSPGPSALADWGTPEAQRSER